MAVRSRLKSRIPEVIAELPARAAAGAHEAAEQIAESARARAPVGIAIEDEHPGRLRDSIETDEQPEGTYVVVRAHAGLDGEGPPYGHFVEFGTVRAAPHPFLLPAAEEAESEFVVHVGTHFRAL